MPKSPDGGGEPALVLLVGKSQRTQVRITNRTAETWIADGEDRIEFVPSWLGIDGAELTAEDAATRLAADLDPGGSQIVNLTVTPPTLSITHLRLRKWRARSPGQKPTFVSDFPVIAAAPEDYARGSLAILEPIPTFPAGVDVSIPLLLSNNSQFDWETKPPAVFNLWGRLGSTQFTLRLVDNLPSGESMSIRFPLVIPTDPGRYKLRLALVRPGTLNFNETRAFEAPTLDLEVASAESVALDSNFEREIPNILFDSPLNKPFGIVGESIPISISLTNDGKWTLQLAYLEWKWLDGPAPNTVNRLKLDGALLPGVRRRVELSMDAPVPGILTAEFKVSLRIGEREDEPVTIGSLEAEIVEKDAVIALDADPLIPPAVLLSEEDQIIALQVANISLQPVVAPDRQTLIFGQRWSPMDAKRAPQHRGGRIVRIPLAPGESEILLLPLSPPPEPGEYRVEFHAHRPNTSLPDRAVELNARALECEVVRGRALAFSAEKRLRRELAVARESAERLAYSHWASRQDTLFGSDRDRLAGHVAFWPRRPLVSVLLPISASTLPMAEATVRSVLDQTYQDWQLCIGLDAKRSGSQLREVLGDLLDDRRVHLGLAPRGADVAALWRSTAGLAQGDFCQLAFPGDALAAHCMVFFCGEVVRDPRLTVLYSDRDERDADGVRHSPSRLSGMDPDMALGQNYIARSLFVETQALRAALPGDGSSNAAWYHELSLRLIASQPGERFRHLPNILYHCGPGLEVGPGEWSAVERALNEHLARTGSAARVSCLHQTQGYRLHLELPKPPPRVSIIIPTRDGLSMLAACVSSILGRTDYPDYEIIVMDNGSERSDTLEYLDWLRKNGTAKVIRDDGEFNWSRLNNRGAAQASGQIYCLLNDDTEVLNDSWLREMVSHAVRADVGAVGAALWFPDGTLQHGGIAFDFGLALPFATLRKAGRDRVRQVMPVAQSTAAVTGACLVTRKEVFETAGGMDEERFPIGYNDIDYCMRVRDYLGLRCVWTPFAELLHKESASRGTPRTEDDRHRSRREASVFTGRWRDSALRDPYFRPDLDVAREFRPPPRPGAVAKGLRYRLPRHRPVAFVHLPSTAGLAVRDLLHREGAGLAVSDLSARMLLGCYDGDPAVLTQLKRWLGDVDILGSHLSFGFGAMVGWDCAYATILREPIERAISHHRRLVRDPSSPLWRSPLAEAPIGLLLRKGVLRGNLQLHKILGRPPERASWSDVDGVGAEFAGFDLPVEVWRQQFDGLLDQPDIAPQDDMALVDQAVDIIERNFVFVGRREELHTHAAAFLRTLGVDQPGRPGQINVAPVVEPSPSHEDIATLQAFHRLDRALYDRIAGLPGGMLMNEALLTMGCE